MSNPKILVTGATGTFGGLLTQQLQQAGQHIRVMVRDSAKFKLGGCEVATGDFADVERVEAALVGIERVFLASFDYGDFVALQGNVIAAAKSQGVKHIVRISTMFLHEPQFASFMDVSIEGERQLEVSGLDFTHLRPSWVLQNFLPSSAATPVCDDRISLPASNGQVGFVDARDVATVAATVLSEPGHEGRAYELTGPEARSHDELALALSHAVGRNIDFENLSPEDYAAQLSEAGWPSKSIHTMSSLFEHMRHGGAAVLTTDVKRVTGRAPFSIHAFARDHAHLFQPKSDPGS